jgi:branched-chain amino acid transport system ATP-binding protein
MANIVLSTQGLTKNFTGFVAVADVDLQVTQGTVHAIIGPNGAGKTTIFNLLTGLMPATSGEIRYKDRDITGAPPAAIARMGMVRSFQITAIFPHLTVRENIRVALQRVTGLSYAFWRHESILDHLDERVRALAESFQLEMLLDTPAVALPYGLKRALELATTMALDPDLLLLDEPMAGLAQSDISRVMGLIREAAALRTVVMVEHNLAVVAELSDFITVLARGRVLAEGPYSEISKDPRVLEAYIGTSHG